MINYSGYRNIPKVSAVYENLNIVEYVTIAVSIHDQTEYNQWPGNVFGNSLLI